jgi:hypothetical protein
MMVWVAAEAVEILPPPVLVKQVTAVTAVSTVGAVGAVVLLEYYPS